MTTPTLTIDDISALRALAEKATPGPWRVYNERLRPQFHGRVIEVQHDGEYAVVSWMGFEESHVLKKQHLANARLISAARDALPRALDTIEAQAATIAERDAEIARLREALANAQIEIDAAQEFGGGFYGDVVAEGTREFYRIEARARAALAKEKADGA